MNSKLGILLGLVLASSGAAFAGDGDATGAVDQSGAGGMGSMQQEQGTAGVQQQQAPVFSEVDTDANGLVSQEEAEEAGAQQVADNFDQADANADGFINRSEYSSLLGEQTLQE